MIDKEKKTIGLSSFLNPIKMGVNAGIQGTQQLYNKPILEKPPLSIQAPISMPPIPQMGQGSVFGDMNTINNNNIPLYDISNMLKPKYDPNKPDFQVSPINPNAEKEWNFSKDQSFDDVLFAIDDAVKNNKKVNDEKIRSIFPEYKDNVEEIQNLYADVYKRHTEKLQYTDDEIKETYRKVYPHLFGKSKADLNPGRNPATKEHIDQQNKNFGIAIENIDKGDGYNYEALSDEGKKMFEYIKKAKSLEQQIRNNYNVPEGTTVYDILKEYKRSDPEGYEKDFGVLEKSSLSLSNGDKRILFGDGKDIDWWSNPITMIKRNFDKSMYKNQEENERLGTEDTFIEKMFNNTIGGVLHGLSKWEQGMSGLQDKGQAHLFSIGSEHDSNYFRNYNRSTIEDLLSLGVGGAESTFQAIFPYATMGFNAVGATKTGEEVIDGTFGNLHRGIEYTLEKTPIIRDQYNKLDEQGKEDLVNGLTMGTSAVIFRGLSKSKMGRKAGAYMSEIKNARRGALEKGISEAKFQGRVEKGLANRSPVVEVEGGKSTNPAVNPAQLEKIDSYQPGARNRVIRAGAKGFREGLKENFKEIPNRVNERMHPKTADPAITDERTIGDKVKSKVDKATETVKNTVDEATDRVKETTKDVNIKNASQKVGEFVKQVESYGKKGAGVVKEMNAKIGDTLKKAKDFGKENIIDPFNKGRGETIPQIQNMREQQGITQNQQHPTFNNAGNKQGDSNQKIYNIKTRVLQNANRMNPKDIRNFRTQYKTEYGDRLIQRGFTKSSESNIREISEYVKNVQSTKEKVFDMIEGKYSDESVVDMLNEVVKRVNETKSPKTNKYTNLAIKYDKEGGLRLSEIEDIRKFFSYEIQPKFFKDANSVQSEKQRNIYTAVKKFLEKTAEENGFTELKNINKEISAGFSIVKGVLNKKLGSGANNNLGLTDYIILAEAIQNPSKRGYVLGKLALKNDKIQNAILKTVIGNRGNIKNRGVYIEREKIRKIADIKKQEQALQDFVQKYFPDNKTPALKDMGASSVVNTIIAPGKPIIQGGLSTLRKGKITEINNIKEKPTKDIISGQNKNKDYNGKKRSLSSKTKNNEHGGSKSETPRGLSKINRQISTSKKNVGIQKSESGTIHGTDNGKVRDSGSKTTNATGRSGGTAKTSSRLNNKKAKEILAEKEFSIDPKKYSPEELDILRSYEGAGGLTKAGEDTTGALDQFYTPEKVINKVWNIVESFSLPGKNVLETSAGTGRFFKDGYKTTGIEIDKTPGTIAKILHPDAEVKIMDFQDLFMDFTGKNPVPYKGGKYDVVVGNPPYKKRVSAQRQRGEEKQIDRFEDYFIKKGVDLLNNDGVLAMVVPSSFLTKPMNYAKLEIAKKAELVDAYRLPEGIFPNTQVGTDIIVLKKGAGSEKGLASNEFFEDNPEKILGEVKTRFNKFGKEESYVEGDGTLLDSIQPKEREYTQKIKEKVEPVEKVGTKQEVVKTEQKGLSKIKKPIQKDTEMVVKITNQKGTVGLSKITNKNNSIIIGEKTDIENKIITSLSESIDPKIEEYQRNTNVDGFVQGVNPESDIKNLNYYKGQAQLNSLYFAGDIYKKLDQLEIDKNSMSNDLYEKQKEGLEIIKPQEYSIDDITFDPNDTKLMETKTEESVWRDTRNPEIRSYEAKEVKRDIQTAFIEYVGELGYNSGLSSREARTYLNNGRLSKDDKNRIIRNTKKFLNKFMKEELDIETRKKIVDTYNRKYRSYVKPRYTDMPLYLRNISATFKGNPLKLLPGQIEGINAMLSKGSMIVAHGVGHGKTLEGVIATMTSLDRGRSKRPLFIVPGPTLNDTWISTIKESYPTKEIVNLGGLTTKDIKRLKKDLGNDPKKWIKDGQVAVITHDGYNNKIDFYSSTKDNLYNDLRDVMKRDDLTARQEEAFNEKIDTIIKTTTKVDQKNAGSIATTLTLDSEFLGEWYDNLEKFGYEEYKQKFIEDVKKKFPGEKTTSDLKYLEGQVDALWELKPIFIEDLGIDHFTVDEAHNYKNIFEKAEMKKDDDGKAIEINRYGDIQGASSKAGRKMYLGTQYIQRKNGNRNVFLLTATPFNNQPIETYNMLSLVGRSRLEELGLFNINEFYSKFANFQEDLVAKPSGTDFDYKRIMKSYENTQELQRLVNEFIDYKGDNEDLVKPTKKLKKVVLEMSDQQKKIQEELEIIIDKKDNLGDVIMGQGQMRLNLISPYITKYYTGPAPTPREFIENSPKLKYATEVIKELRAKGKEDGVFIYMPFGTDFHKVFSAGISEIANIPESKIGIINGKITKDQKDKIAEKYRKGEINVLIGGTNTVEGIDLQKNGYITINTLLGWNPTERTQLNGRQRRQGNLRSEVLEVLPLLENSADIVMMQKSEEKQSRINNIFEYQGKVFDTEEINPMEEKLALLTSPEKKAKVWENIQKRKLQNEKENLSANKEMYNKLILYKRDIQGINGIENEIKHAQENDMEYRLPSLKKTLTELKRKKKWYDEKIKRLNIEDPETGLKDIEKNIENIEREIMTLEEQIPEIIEKYKKEQEQAKKGKMSMEDYIEDIKKDFDELEYFENIEEQKKYLKNKGLSKLSR